MRDEEKKLFKELMGDEELQLPKRFDETYQETLCKLLDYYSSKLRFLNTKQRAEIMEICTYLKQMAGMNNSDDIFTVFCEMMNKSKLLSQLHIIKDELPIDGYGRANRNLFRIRGYESNHNYKRKDIFHLPMSSNQNASALRYNLAGFPSLYLSSTIYACCVEMGKNEQDKLMGSLFRMNKEVEKNSLYILDLGVRPIDYVKHVNYEKTGRRAYMYTQYLYVYPLIAACSFIAADKDVAYVKEYSITNALYRWLYKYHSEAICGVRYFSCAKKEYIIKDEDKVLSESEENNSFTHYFINYALSVEEGCPEFSKKLSTVFSVTKPKFLEDFKSIKTFENGIKKDTNSLGNIFE